MKTYIAAKFSRREEMEQEIAPSLPWLGYEVNARWVFGGEDGLSREEIANLDLEDVKNSDMIILFTHPREEPQPGGGRFVEFGYALALGKRCVVIGPKENVFMEVPGVEVYETWDQFVDSH